MNVILIYPPRGHYIFGVTPHVHVEADAGSYPPIGLLYIAAALERLEGCRVHVIDAHTDGLTHRQVAERAACLKADVVGIYVSTYYLHDSILTARLVRELLPGAVIIAGGPHIILYPRETVLLPEFDYVMAGESEHTFPRAVELLARGDAAALEALPNVISKRSPQDKVPVRERVEDLDALPFPARHLLDPAGYRSILARRNPITTVITSRGCPFRCSFCSNIESGQKVRYRSAGNVVDELESVVKQYGITDFLFFDELFTSDRKRVVEICDEILRRRLRIRWHCRSRADVLDEDLVRLMKRAGCRLIQFGIETGSPRLQKSVNKNLDLGKVRGALRMVYAQGIYTYADFMFGLPTETEEEARQTLAYALSLPLDYVAFGGFHPIPGSVFYERFLKDGVMEDFWRGFVRNPEIPIADYTYTRKDRPRQELIVPAAYNAFYLRPGYLFRKLLRIDSFPQLLWQVRAGFRVFSRFFGGGKRP